jgi:hypothetical protein
MSIPKATNTISINRPIEDVFEFLSDAENDVKWRSGVLDIKGSSGIPVGGQALRRPRNRCGDKGSRLRAETLKARHFDDHEGAALVRP